MLEEEDWTLIKARRGTAFVERWRAHVGPPSLFFYFTVDRQTGEIHVEDEEGRYLAPADEERRAKIGQQIVGIIEKNLPRA